MTAITINADSINLSDEQFFQFCQDNRDLRIERNTNGDIIIMPPVGGASGNRNGRLTQQLFNWSDLDGTGIAFDSSTGFTLPNGADRSPDAAWIPLEKWNNLTSTEQEKFLPLCPDFVVELRSPSDSLSATQKKMQEYLNNGTRLAWLINRQDRKIEIYRQNQDVEILDNPTTLSGENILPGLILNLELIW
ncbi:Uma2 family endonuclease [Gloeothece verrucosa]|uniref:Putative restriction endonuclease domain-containing protein n=1 Tax=Gloeothece verrucosa (strain PCC 7822) TaxID=497965 RepID=E0U6M7_GLOV7|nr:Uma2 family endonuclease [Gloeothece verrucosa]ADN14786.1 protein of unknown function DUF820 [Gloeothece verrucosa PCC 7822]